MSQYLLLRNNKESGPYSAEQLISMGLKAYDLVWEDGRSAAWRYPSEVPALKAFAPAAEDEPSDKSVEKQNENAAATLVKKEKPRIKIKADWKKVEAENSENLLVNKDGLNFKEPVFIQAAKKEVINGNFGNEKYPAINDEASAFDEKAEAIRSTAINHKSETTKNQTSWKDAWLDWEEEKKSVSSFKKEPQKKTLSEKKYDFVPAKKTIEAPKLETKFSQSLDNIKEKYVENILRSKEKKSFDLSGILNKQVFVLVALIGLISWGMYVSFFMKDDNMQTAPGTAKVTQAPVRQAVTVPKDISAAQTADENLTADDNSLENDQAQDDNAVSTNKNNLPSQHNNITAPSSKLKQVLKKISPSASSKNSFPKQNIKTANTKVYSSNKTVPVKNNLPVPTNIATSQPAAHSQVVQQNNGQYTRTVARRTDNNSSQNSAVNNPAQNAQPVATSSFPHASPKKRIEDYVAVSSSGSGYSGIQNVHLNVQNITDIPIDLAVVDIQYFDANNRFQKGETVYVNNIPANDNVAVKVPDSRSSVRINYKISLVSASQKTLYMVQ